jgi:MoaA/NifB/PqqE/SkfB family radical SAM enzyme
VEQLVEAKKDGVDRILFTGGEPTIRKDLIELVSYAKNLGYGEIFIITNGRMFSYPGFSRRIRGAGLTNVLFSLHASEASMHDCLTRTPGSFSQTVQGIKNLKELGGVMIATNTVVNKKNYRDLPKLVQFLVNLGVEYCQFIFINPMTISRTTKRRFEEFIPRISKAAPFVHRALDVAIRNNVACSAEAIPLCHMKGYEKYTTELLMLPERTVVGPDSRFDSDLNKSRREKSKVKSKKCKSCTYHTICEGIWGSYADHYGVGELRPVR